MESDQRKQSQAWMALVLAGCSCLWQAVQSAPIERGSKEESQATTAEATNAVASLQVEKGFRVELVAMEPVVSAPSAIAFDEDGRLFVAEMPDNPNVGSKTPPPGRICVLEDRLGNGVFDTRMVYAEDVPQPSALACYGGGVFVAATPELIYLKNSVTNRAADERKVIGRIPGATNAPIGDGLLTQLSWGLDNRIHGAMRGGPGGGAASGLAVDTPIDQPAAEFTFDPRGGLLAMVAGPPESGLSFDNWGRRFACDPSHPLRQVMYEERYMARNPFFAAPGQMHDAASSATAIYSLAAGKAVSGLSQGAGVVPAEQRNLAGSGWLTNACGCLIYRGNAFPPGYQGNAFVADPAAHVIHRMVLRENGLEAIAVRPENEPRSEFLASKEASFHPVQVLVGPDGGLYVVDRQNGSDRGRIYRIVPDGFKRPKMPRLGQATTYELVAMLSHPNGWTRDTAARLLYTRQDPAAGPLLASVLTTSRIPLARVQALQALAGLGALNAERLVRGLQDAEDRVREQAVRLAEGQGLEGGVAEGVWNQLRGLALDPSLRVRYQLALTLGQIGRVDRAAALGAIMARDLENPWVEAAVLSSAAAGGGNLFQVLAAEPGFRNDPKGQAFLQRLAIMIGVQGSGVEVNAVLEFIDRTSLEARQSFGLLGALGEGLRRGGSSLAQADRSGRMERFYFQALGLVVNGTLGAPVALEDLRLISVSPYTFQTAGDQLLLLLGTDQPDRVRLETLKTLARFDDRRVVPAIFRRWPALPRSLKQEVAPVLLTRSSRAGEVMAAIEGGLIPGSDLSPVLKDFVRTDMDPQISQRALRWFGEVPKRRPEAVRQYTPALRLKGNAASGQQVFRLRCASCHRLGGEGQALGPDLAEAKIYGRTKALAAILEPNAVIRTNYSAYVVATGDGDCRIGVLGSANVMAVTLRQPGGVAVVLPRKSIASMQVQPWSMMPSGLESGFSLQNMADLLEYLMASPR